ncbi:MAG: triose-phosphate isomerase [Roseiflexaceae bacterium]|nr:triose-phosphate isomerase [Roseiflexaceae bacterium]
MRVPLIAGNWKMYKTVAEAVDLVDGLLAGLGNPSDREIVVCPPFTALHALSPLLQGTAIRLGAQDVYPEVQGAFTGAISPIMLRDLGCQYVIVGHSERRQIFGEGDALINRKLHSAMTHGLRPILCVGETKPERDSGRAESVVVGQLRGCLEGVAASAAADLVVAYEPVWAIGTGDTATPADAQSMHAAIRQVLAEILGSEAASSIRLQYGGSVKPDNVDELMAQPDIDGALVGGASLKADSFLRIVQFR